MAVSLPKRSEVPEKYTWNLANIFPSEDAWRKALDEIMEDLPKLTAYKGRLGEFRPRPLPTGSATTRIFRLRWARCLCTQACSATPTPATKNGLLCATRHAGPLLASRRESRLSSLRC